MYTCYYYVLTDEEYLNPELVKAYQDCYSLADEVFMYELSSSKMKNCFVKYDEMCLCAREFDLSVVADIQSRYELPVVFVSVGRSVDLAEVIDVSNEPYHFIVTEGIQLVGENVTYLAKETPNTHDYLCASEFVITKAGFGTVAEALLAMIEQEPGHRLISLATYGKEEMGYLVPLDEDIPFEVKRIFYLTDVPKEVSRGRYAYYETKQVLICVSGEVKVKCQEGEREVIYHLRDNKQGLYLEPHVWREAYDFSEGAVLLVLSSQIYAEKDYIRC